jgi:hypothetical protein
MRRLVLLSLMAGQLLACATTHEFHRSAMPSVARAVSPRPGRSSLGAVRDRDGQLVPFGPETRMTLHLTDGRQRVEVDTVARDLRIGPSGVWLPDDTFVAAPYVEGFAAVDPHSTEKTLLAVGLPILGAAAAVFFMSGGP